MRHLQGGSCSAAPQITTTDSYGQSARFTFVPSDGEHPSLVTVDIRNGSGVTVATLQYAGERHIARLFAALDSLMNDPSETGAPIRPLADCGQCPHSEESHEHIGGARPWLCHECDDGSASPENVRQSHHAAIPAKRAPTTIGGTTAYYTPDSEHYRQT